jgi:adsorption protein B
MELLVVDAAAHYFYALHCLAWFCALVILASSIDDVFVDVAYWMVRLGRLVGVARRPPLTSTAELARHPQRPIAIMAPAWKESDVIAHMVENAVATYDYEVVHIFIGVYPNDPDTAGEADKVVARYPNVHKITVPHPGPTCKADCLNWIIRGIFDFEEASGIHFEGIVLHDAEDVVHPLELQVFNALLDRYDLIQVPILSLVRKWHEFVAGHYVDEFAELHTKDLIVREALTGVVPGAGVATCYSRRGLEALARVTDGDLFNTSSLTEDYDFSFRMRQLGLKETFVRLYVEPDGQQRAAAVGLRHELVATREYFPDRFQAAVRQKSRWILGIVFQGWHSVRWERGLLFNYFLMRDRKALVTSPVGALGYLLALNVILLWLVNTLVPSSYRFPPIIEGGTPLYHLIQINFLFLLNRVVHRLILIGGLYDLRQGLLSIPRMVVANFVNFGAFYRAARRWASHLATGERIAWDKTAHSFPIAQPVAQSVATGA